MSLPPQLFPRPPQEAGLPSLLVHYCLLLWQRRPGFPLADHQGSPYPHPGLHHHWLYGELGSLNVGQ
ncbi:hypothetical protein I79_013155 [Cricetulus griseus]|uniref:Uncharacterized protein n=1 Tax=Cricetulus griseus TaxID=10029 RepID=G3HQQ0_CRIGR|nr:hypothetical protein I79_013155 [Cricetulus griseus]